MAEREKKDAAQLKGDVFLLSEKKGSFTSAQLRLLEAISESGSISRAAKVVGISYKTAWDRVDAINNLSEHPVVVRTAGGAKGGGTTLTEHGRRIVEGFRALAKEHDEFVRRVGDKLRSFTDVANFVGSGFLDSSARNQYRGVIECVRKGVVNAEIELRISDSRVLVVQVTLDSAERLGLKRGMEVKALVKSSWIVLSKDTAIATSARNKLTGTIDRIVKGAVNDEVTVDLGSGKSICALISNASIEESSFREGDSVCAIFKASSIILVKD